MGILSPPEGFNSWDEYDRYMKETGPSLRKSYPNKITEVVATNPISGFLVPGAEQFLQKGGKPSSGDLAFGILDAVTGPIPAGAMAGSIIKKGRNFWRKKKETPAPQSKMGEVKELPELVYYSNHPTKSVADLLEDRIRLEQFDSTMPDEVVRHFDGVNNFPNYTETAADAAAEKVRFSKWLDTVQEQMARDGLTDPSQQASVGFKFYNKKRVEADVLWAKEQSGGELPNKLGVTLDEWRELTFGKSDDEIDTILSGLKKKKRR